MWTDSLKSGAEGIKEFSYWLTYFCQSRRLHPAFSQSVLTAHFLHQSQLIRQWERSGRSSSTLSKVREKELREWLFNMNQPCATFSELHHYRFLYCATVIQLLLFGRSHSSKPQTVLEPRNEIKFNLGKLFPQSFQTPPIDPHIQHSLSLSLPLSLSLSLTHTHLSLRGYMP